MIAMGGDCYQFIQGAGRLIRTMGVLGVLVDGCFGTGRDHEPLRMFQLTFWFLEQSLRQHVRIDLLLCVGFISVCS